MSTHANNRPEQKAAWEASKGRSGSRFIKTHPSTVAVRNLRGRGLVTGRFSTRTLQSLCNWKERMEDGRIYHKEKIKRKRLMDSKDYACGRIKL